jgi:hypothetical protein
MKINYLVTLIITLLVGPSSPNVFADINKADSCFSSYKLEAGFIAFTAAKKSQLGQWYKDTFGLETVKEFSFPDGNVTGILMRNKEFVVEVYYRNEAFNHKDYVPGSKEEQWLGVNKFGIYTNADLPKLKECLVSQGINTGRLWKDKLLGIDLLQVVDPNDNVLEIIQRRKIK